jgi:dGTPase
MADAALFETVATETGLRRRDGEPLAWFRHPLAWLVEAADDICYRIIDIEDGHREGHLSYPEARDLLLPLAGDTSELRTRMAGLRRHKQRVELLRAKAINRVVDQVFECFMEREQDFLAGAVDREILEQLPLVDALDALMEVARSRLYFCRPVVEIATAGFQVLGGLLDIFMAALEDVASHGKQASTRSRMLLHLLPEGERAPALTPYQRLLTVTDFVSGMTDTYAVSLFKKLTGISLPGR